MLSLPRQSRQHLHPSIRFSYCSAATDYWLAPTPPGRFTEAWRHYYQQYLGSKATNRKNGHTWVTSVITTIFTQWKELWQIRNHDRHGKDYKAQADVAHRQAVTELMTLYELQDSVEPHLKWLFDTPLYQLQNKRTSYC